MNALIDKLCRRVNSLLACSIVAAALISAHGVEATDGGAEELPTKQSATVVLDDPGATTGSLPGKSVAIAETVQRFRMHRSPVRSNSVDLSVVTLDTEEERTIELPGVAGMSFNKICRTSDGVRIACGSRARIQLVNFVTRREMTCTMSVPAGAPPKALSCAIDGVDVAEWIVRSGIGRPNAEGLHAAAAREARNSQRGMWADAETRDDLVLAVRR